MTSDADQLTDDDLWPAVCELARSSYPVIDDTGDSLTLSLAFTDDGAGSVAPQVVTLRCRVVLAEPWLEVEAPVCSHRELPMVDVLEHNTRIAVGALCLQSGHYVWRGAWPLVELTRDGVDRLIVVGGHIAASLRAYVEPAATALQAFDMYAA